jgi:hypothetical protein
MIDFEAFGQSIDADLSKTPWPPTGPSITRPHSPSVLVTDSGLVNNDVQDPSTTAGGNPNFLKPDYGWGMGMGMNMGLDDQAEDDGFGWLSGLGAGEGFFGTDNANGNGNGNGNGNEGDLGFTQDLFWSVFSYVESPSADSQEIDPGPRTRTAVRCTVGLLASCISCIAVIAVLTGSSCLFTSLVTPTPHPMGKSGHYH